MIRIQDTNMVEMIRDLYNYRNVIYVCVYVCMCVCVYVFVCVSMCVFMCVHLYIYA